MGGWRAQPLHFLTYGTSSTPEPGCYSDPACNAGFAAGVHAFNDAVAAGVNPRVPWWLDVEGDGHWSGTLILNAIFVQAALTALHEYEGVPDVGIYASPGVWNSIVGTYEPDVPYWMADYLEPPSGPATCADYAAGWHGLSFRPGHSRSCSTAARSSTRTTPADHGRAALGVQDGMSRSRATVAFLAYESHVGLALMAIPSSGASTLRLWN